MHRPHKARAYLRRLNLVGEAPQAVLSGLDLDLAGIDCLNSMPAAAAGDVFEKIGVNTPSDFAVKCGSRAKISDLGAVGYHLLFAPNLRAAMEIWAANTALASAPFHAQFRYDAQHWYFEQTAALPYGPAGYRFCAEAAIASMVRLNSELVDRPLTFREVSVPFGPSDDRSALAQLGYENVRYNAENFCIVGDSRDLDLPVAAVDLQNLLALERRIDTSCGESLLARVWRRLGELERVPTLAGMADDMAMSMATFHRRLQAENTNYRKIVLDFSRGYAENAIAEGQSVKRIAWRLGYDDPSSFRRAFSRWTGGSGLRGGDPAHGLVAALRL